MATALNQATIEATLPTNVCPTRDIHPPRSTAADWFNMIGMPDRIAPIGVLLREYRHTRYDWTGVWEATLEFLQRVPTSGAKRPLEGGERRSVCELARSPLPSATSGAGYERWQFKRGKGTWAKFEAPAHADVTMSVLIRVSR